MPESDDITLLKQYVEGDESAFAVLVERYVHLVYSTAMRQAGNPSQAEEITQAVFIILAQKAKSIGPRTILSGWLYQAARLVAANFLRSEIRRQKREQEAYMESLLNEPTPNLWQHIAPLLDDAMGHLSEKDRNVVVLRFFQNKSAADIGDALGIDSATAQKRITRAVGRLRKYFAKRSVAHSTELITGAISANSVQAAPVALAKSVAALAIAKGAAASGSTLTLVKGVLKIMAWTKAKMAVAAGACVLVAAGTMTVTVVEIQEHRTYPWQVATANSDEDLKALNTTPPQVTIVRSKFTTDGHGGLIDDIPPKNQWRYIGIHFTPSNIIERAYSEGFPLLPSQIILPSNIPGGFYDYIANLANDSQQALQALIKKKFGLVGKYEMRDMDVLLLKVEHPNALGLKPGTPQMQSGLVTHGLIHNKNISISRLAKDLGWDLQIPVIDQTGLVGNYDFDFPEDLGATPAEKLEKAKQWLLADLGLKLVPNREPIEMLVVEKVK